MTRMSIRRKRLLRGKEAHASGGEADGAHRWAISYADFMTLLLAIFLAAYFMTAKNGGKTAAAQAAPKPAHPAPVAAVAGPSPVKDPMQDINSKIMAWIEQSKLEKMVDVEFTPRGTSVSFKDKLLFASGQAALTVPARSALGQFGKVLRAAPFMIRVEGHTDNVPIVSPYVSNWDLGAARAATVLYYLVNREDVSPDKISLTSYGETRPRVPNDTPEHRAENRRVNIVILSAPYAPVMLPVPQRQREDASGPEPPMLHAAAKEAAESPRRHI